MCVYAPTKPNKRRTFFEDIVKLLECDRKVFFLGDFNCVCRRGDRSNENAPFDPSAIFLLESISRLLLEDVICFANATCAAKFTHFQGVSHARLDRIYVSSDLGPSCNDYSVEPVSFSDHCLVTVCVGGKKQSRAKFNWALWKLNEKLRKDDKFVSIITEKRDELLQTECKNCIEKWECFKQVKILTIECS